MPLQHSNAGRFSAWVTSFFVVVVALILCTAANLWADPVGESATPNDVDLDDLLEIYRAKEANIQAFELHWKEEVRHRKENGAYEQYPRQWKMVVDGDKTRTEERGISDAKHPENPNSIRIITAFDGKVGKRVVTPEGSALSDMYPIGRIQSEDVSEPLNNNMLLPAMLAFRPHKVLTWQRFSPTQWKVRKDELEGQPAIILSRRTHSGRGVEQVLYVDPSDYTIKRVMNLSPAGNRTQCDIRYRSEVARGSEPIGWTWTSFDEQGKARISRSTRSVLSRINPTILPTEFNLEFPIGTMVTEGPMMGDTRTQKSYVIGPNHEQKPVPNAGPPRTGKL